MEENGRLGSGMAMPGRQVNRPAWRDATRAAVIGAALLLAACQSPAQRAAEAMALGQQLAASGQFAAAQKQFNIAVAARDDIPELWMMRARNQVALADYAGAFGSFRNALDQDRTNREALDAMAQLSLATGRLDEARNYATQILALDPNNVTALLVDASVAFRRGRLQYVEPQIARIRELDPNNETGIILASQFAQRRGRMAQALALVEPTFLKGGGGRELRRQLTALYQRSGNARGLLAVAQRDATELPKDMAVQRALAKQLLLNGMIPEAVRLLNDIHRATPGDAQRDLTTAMLADAVADPSALAKALTAISPTDPELSLAVANHALGVNDYATAERVLAPAARDRQVGPDTADEQGSYALALAGLGRFDEASRRAGVALRFDGGQTTALMARSLVQLAAGDITGALRNARVLNAASPDFAPGAALLARVQLAAGNQLLADKALFDSVNADRNNPVALRHLAAMLVKRGRASDAAEYAQNFTVQNPASVAGWTVRQQVCAQINDNSCATRSAAMIARLHGRDVALPPTPDDEILSERDYNDDGDDK